MPFLEIAGLSKSFPGVDALQRFDLEAEFGEVHAIVGANGAGKSTLMNILAGALAPSAGEIRVGGKTVATYAPREARELGISTVFQEFSLIPQLSVARNIFLGREPVTTVGMIDIGRLNAETQSLLDRYRFGLRAEDIVEDLSVAEQQFVEIARALSVAARVLVLDEPTAVLSLREQENLFDIIDKLKRDNLLVLYVSHRLDEVFAIADRVTVLRDGKKIGTMRTAETDQAALVRMMIGHDVRQWYPLPKVDPVGPPVLQVTYRSAGGVTRFAVRRGEIIGLAGFVGAGRSYLARALVGLAKRDEIELKIAGRPRHFRSPEHAIRDGVVYLTEDRKRDGLFANLSVLVNTTAAGLGLFSRLGLIRKSVERAEGGGMLARLRLVASSLTAPVQQLSGGNQQKVVFGRALLCKPKVLICDEPTRSVDVGAKDEIYDLLIELADQGVAIIVISSEVKELLMITHRILVMRNRAVVEELQTRQAEEDQILLAATGRAT